MHLGVSMDRTAPRTHPLKGKSQVKIKMQQTLYDLWTCFLYNRCFQHWKFKCFLWCSRLWRWSKAALGRPWWDRCTLHAIRQCVTSPQPLWAPSFPEKMDLPSMSFDRWRLFSRYYIFPPTEEINLENASSEASHLQKLFCLHFSEQEVLPVPSLCTDRGTQVLWPCHTHPMPELWDWDMGMISRGQPVPGFHPGVSLYVCSTLCNQIQGIKISLTPWLYVDALPPGKLSKKWCY